LQSSDGAWIARTWEENGLLVLNEDQVRSVLRMESLIPAMEQALIDFSSGRVVQPVRNSLSITGHAAFLGVMPAVYGEVMGAKLVTVYPKNTAAGLPSHQALIVLFRSSTGEPLAVMDGRLITEMRTAAVTAAATRLLAKPDARVLAILGSGVQARSHFDALRLVRRFEEVRVWSRTPEKARRFAAEIGARPVSAEQAVRGADVVVTVTGSPGPILRGEWLERGALVNAVGAVGPKRRELDDEAMQKGAVVVDSREAALVESGDVLLSRASIHSELGELLAGAKPKPPAGIIVFKSLGIAVEDLAAAKLVYGTVEGSA
jgi:ornithine cyclodeaminase/alanine dehydrogenase-like protein (mu-crystallin family)